MEQRSPAAADARPVRFGVIGAGWFASRRHIPEMHKSEKIELAAVCRRDPAAREKIRTHFELGDNQCFEDWRDMLDAVPLDAVLIATPNDLHFEQASEALDRGINVLLEKPMTIRGEDAWALAAKAKALGLQLSAALNPPFWAHCHRMRRALRSPEMGKLESASMYWTGSATYVFGKAPAPENLPGVVPPTSYRSNPDANGGGYFIDGGSHLVSEMLWVTDAIPKRVFCSMDETPTDMRASLLIEMTNGAICSINSIGDSEFPNRRVRNIFGASGGTITVNGFEFDTTVSVHGREFERFKEEDLPSVPSPVGNFCAAVRGSSPLYSPPEHGALVVDLVEGAYRSAASGEAVLLPDRSTEMGR